MSGLLPRFEDLEDAISWAIKRTTPPQGFSRQLIAYSNHLSDLTKEIAERADFPIVDVILAGSVSRETYLPWSVDIDLFARLDVAKKTELARFSSEVLPKVSSAEKAQIEFRYAENPYGHFSTAIMDREVGVDIVATVYATQKNLTSALEVSGMARTPFHNDFLQTHLQGLTDQVRLLKWWFVRKKVYGQFGFTGFLTEFLMSHFREFTNVLKAANEISQARIDFWQRKPSELEDSFPGDQVIIVDPVDTKRNAAAGIQGIVGQFKLERFLRESVRSLDEPGTLLDKTSPTVPYYELRTNFEPAPRNIDEEVSRLARVAALIKGILRKEEIKIIDLYLEKKPAALQFKLDRHLLTTRTVKGPPEELISAVSKFKARHKDFFSKNGRLFAQKPSRFKSINDLILDALRTQHWIISPDLKYLEKQEKPKNS